MQIGVRNETHCQSENVLHYAFWSVVRMQHSIKKMLRVTKLHNVLDEVNTPCDAGMAVKRFPPGRGELEGGVGGVGAVWLGGGGGSRLGEGTPLRLRQQTPKTPGLVKHLGKTA